FVMRFASGDNQWRDFSDSLPISGLPPDTARLTPEVISLGISQDQHLFAGTDSTGVWRTTGGTNAVKNMPAENGIALSNAYPNPAASSTAFLLSTDHEIRADIAVFDALGRKLFDIAGGMLS